jgi:hypothetical protein
MISTEIIIIVMNIGKLFCTAAISEEIKKIYYFLKVVSKTFMITEHRCKYMKHF